MQTIVTKFLPATTTLGSRIKATSEGGSSATIPYPDELYGLSAHMEAVQELNKILKWKGDMIVGGTKKGFVFVFAGDSRMTLRN